MFTRLKQFIARLRFAWNFASRMPWMISLVDLAASTTYKGAEYGVQKAGLDTSLKGAHNETLRCEAIEWANHWYRDQHISPHPWEIRICVELAVGRLKGYIS
jgi:hypothetical protein